MTASPRRRRLNTLVGLMATLALLVVGGVLFVVGVVTLSNSQEGEAVGIDERPRSVFPATPNALLAVADGDELVSVAVATLLPDGVGGSIVVIPANADATAGFGSERRPLDSIFDADDIGGFASTVEEMLATTIERELLVDVDELDMVFGVEPDADVDDEASWTEFWAEVAESAPVEGDDVPVDPDQPPSAPADAVELIERLLAGEVQSRVLSSREPAGAQNPEGLDVVIVDRRDANLVFAQVSPALVSTPNPGLTVRIVAPFTQQQIDESDGRYGSTSELALDVIGEMLFFQANVVSVDTTPAADGAAEVTSIDVSEERFIEDLETISSVVFGDSEVVLASSVIDGIDVVITLGTDYIANKLATPEAELGEEPTGSSTPPDGTVTADE